jgi:hypothetical protein
MDFGQVERKRAPQLGIEADLPLLQIIDNISLWTGEDLIADLGLMSRELNQRAVQLNVPRGRLHI